MIKMKVVCVVIVLMIASISVTVHGRTIGTNKDSPNKRFLLYEAADGKRYVIDREAKVETNEEVNNADLTMYLYTQSNPQTGTKIPMDMFSGSLEGTGFNPEFPSYFFIHGWTIDHTSFYGVRALVLANGRQVNLFLLDYKRIAKFFYTDAVASIPAMARIFGTAIQTIQAQHNINSDLINLVGHSLGGQLSGAVGAYLKGNVNQIIALDPAGPLFENEAPEIRLDPTDARVVHVVHSNGGILGYRGSLGHVDFFPNGGGMNQPGCDEDLLGICAHIRAINFYYESITSDGFVAQRCDSYADYQMGVCKENPTAVMGTLIADKSLSGNYYLDTAAETPYALG